MKRAGMMVPRSGFSQRSSASTPQYELAGGRLPALHSLQQRFTSSDATARQAVLDAVDSVQHPLSAYDRLLPGQAAEVC